MEQWARGAWLRFRSLGRIGWIAAVFYFCALLVMVAWALLAWEDTAKTRPINEIAYLLCLILAAACAGLAARAARGRRPRYGWLALIVALAAWAVAEIVWVLQEFRPDLWHPSLAQAVLMAYPLGAYAAMLLLHGFGAPPRRRAILDGIVVATSLFVVSWVFVLSDMPEGGVAPATTVLHVSADVILLTTSILVWSRPRARLSLNLLAAGITTIGMADIIGIYVAGIGGYHNGGLIDIARVAGFGMCAFAALFSIDERGPVEVQPLDLQAGFRVWLPYLPLLLAGVVGIGYELRHHDHGLLLVVEAVLVVVCFVAPVLRSHRQPTPSRRSGPRGVSRQLDRPGQQGQLPRQAGARRGPPAPQRRADGGVVPRPRQLQGRQRRVGSSGGGRAVDSRRRPADKHAG